MDNKFKGLIDVNEASKLYNLTPQAIKISAKANLIEGEDYKKFGNSYVFVKKSLDTLFNKRKKNISEPQEIISKFEGFGEMLTLKCLSRISAKEYESHLNKLIKDFYSGGIDCFSNGVAELILIANINVDLSIISKYSNKEYTFGVPFMLNTMKKQLDLLNS